MKVSVQWHICRSQLYVINQLHTTLAGSSITVVSRRHNQDLCITFNNTKLSAVYYNIYMFYKYSTHNNVGCCNITLSSLLEPSIRILSQNLKEDHYRKMLHLITYLFLILIGSGSILVTNVQPPTYYKFLYFL